MENCVGGVFMRAFNSRRNLHCSVNFFAVILAIRQSGQAWYGLMIPATPTWLHTSALLTSPLLTTYANLFALRTRVGLFRSGRIIFLDGITVSLSFR